MLSQYTDFAPEERFWPRVNKTESCWLWIGTRNHYGYGCLKLGGRSGRLLTAHRIAFELTHGPIPEGLRVLHTCDVPACVNPAHLYLGTAADNTRDMIDRGRHGWVRHPESVPRGEQGGGHKLTTADVQAIRADHAAGMSLGSLGRRHSVSKQHIRRIVDRSVWRHVP